MRDCSSIRFKKSPFYLALLAALLLSSCGVHSLHVQQSPLLKYFARKSGLIAYVGTDGNIHIADQSGRVINVTTNGQTGSSATVSYGSPAWAYNGKEIVFAEVKTSPRSHAERTTVYTANASGKDKREIFKSSSLAPFYFYWSPNDREIGMLSQVLGAQGAVQMGVLRVTAKDPAATYRVLSADAPFYWVWGPESKSLVAHTESSNAPNASDFVRIFAVNGSKSRYRQLKAYLGAFNTPAIAGGGKDVVIPIGSTDASDLVERNLKTGRQRLLSKSLGSVSYVLSPNGKWLAYIDQADPKDVASRRLHIVNMRNPKDSYTVKERPVFTFYWSPNSREIAYFTPLQSKASIDSIFAHSNQIPYAELQVVDVASKDSWSVTQFPVTQAFLNGVPFNDQNQYSGTIWSPDSKYLVFSAYTAQGKPGIFVASADGNIKPDRIANGDFPTWSWH